MTLVAVRMGRIRRCDCDQICRIKKREGFSTGYVNSTLVVSFPPSSEQPVGPVVTLLLQSAQCIA